MDGEGWVAAGDLVAGDSIRRADGSIGTLASLHLKHHSQAMFNLTVEQAHTFFVGDLQWLVHNDCSLLHDAVVRLHDLKSTQQIERNQTTIAVVQFANDQGDTMNVVTNNYRLSSEQIAEAQRIGWQTVQPESFHQNVATCGGGNWHAEEIIMWH